MQIEIKMDEAQTEPKVIILTNKVTEEITELVKRLSEEKPQLIAGFQNDTVVLLKQPELIRIYTADSKVFAVTDCGEYQLRFRLYELEKRLDEKYFVRISNSEIINLKKVKKFDLSFTGTICVSLSNNTITYVSRRYVSKIKQALGI